MPGFAIFLALICLAAAGKAILADSLDPDCFWHLRVGQELLEVRWPPHPIVDHLSFSSASAPWTPYSWLAEMGMAKLWDVGGFRAALLAQALCQALFYLFMGVSCLELTRQGDQPPRYLPALLATAAGAVLSLAYLSFRPVTMALVLIAAADWLLLRDRRLNQQSKAVWFVPPLTALATNIHFFAWIIPLTTAALAAGDWLGRTSSARPRRLGRGALLFAATAVAAAATPMLPGTIHAIRAYAASDVMVHSNFIAEMKPFYAGAMGHVSAILVAAIFVCVILHPFRAAPAARLGFGEVLWLIGSAILLMCLGRFAPIFALIAAPVFAATLPRLGDRVLTRPLVQTACAAVVLLASWRIAGAFPRKAESLSQWLNRHGPGNYPCAAADFVQSHVHPVSHRLICEFTWGGYLEWRLGDRFQTFMDGRTQVFPADFWRKVYFQSTLDQQQMLFVAHADAAIVPLKNSRFAASLLALGWRRVYQDATAQVLLPPPDASLVAMNMNQSR